MKTKLQAGFALPTVVIVGTVLFGVMTIILGTTASTRSVLDAQFYQALARDAAESGSMHAEECLKQNNFAMTWSTASPLRPNTTCAGGAACTGTANCYVIKTNQYTTSYTVGVDTSVGDGVQQYTVKATVDLLRTSGGSVWKSYVSDVRVKTGGQIGQNNVVFGYSYTSPRGAFFATIGGDGKMRAAGLNNYGQLGNGTTTDQAVPVVFGAPTTSPIVSAYTNFLSIGWNLYAIDANGDGYGSGWNSLGQLGIGSSASPIATPAKISLPAGKKLKHIVPGGWANYFLTTDNNVYAAGECSLGRLGYGYTIAGCSPQQTPVRVALPAPTINDPSTIPTTNMVSDRYTVYVRMAGGQVYGWGDNESGELGVPDYAPKSSPVKIGSYGDPGQPKAVDVKFDGNSVYILDSLGKVSSMGGNNYGQHGTRESALYNPAVNKCIDNLGGNGLSIGMYACNNSAAQKFQIRANGTIYLIGAGKCLDNAGADGVTLRFIACNGSAAQLFTYDPASLMWRNPQSNKCIGNPSGSTVQLVACVANSPAQVFYLTSSWLVPFNMNGISGRIAAITTDQTQLSVLTDQGEVWSAGINTTGMAGNGRTGAVPFSPEFDPVKFQLPAGVKGTYIYSTNSAAWNDTNYKNLFVVGDNGKVYGAGSNAFGQLGNGTTAIAQSTPVAMNSIDGTNLRAREVQVGFGTTVIFTTNNQVYTVGNNNTGQVGDGTTTNRSVPYLSKFINQATPTRY